MLTVLYRKAADFATVILFEASGFPIHLENPVGKMKNEYGRLKNEEYKAKIPPTFVDRIFALVEMGRIELPSESASSGTSPGADGYLRSLVRAQAVMLADSVASWCMARSKLCVLTVPTHRRLFPGRGPPGRDARAITQREEQCCRCSLIYKLPVLWMPGASARYSCLRTPVAHPPAIPASAPPSKPVHPRASELIRQIRLPRAARQP